MISGRIEGATRTLGKSQGYLGLSIRDELQNTTTDGPETPTMVSAWFPTPDELSRLVEGAPLYLHVVGRAHPPVSLTVGSALSQLNEQGERG